ncbi:MULTISPECIES: LD-carboxypeptidase [Clostridium]|uniref:LD-carboxypeptidase n=1 Tax=Clostridium aquiflavi TaxID=3073603 RepID=A0ABU1EEM5_9CLOT|nr:MULTISPECIES: LD-carboxypeptidase [unclassified Clostridium]MDR5586724.1 LD-carboxypeptidase [Clostridium sp. 5N-1]NFG62312.1 LD-carboxypeptidase [Clostridium botulinum]NFQ09651.1 LD-carboxypeptidase [Clostridium botulinum]
MRRPKPLKKGDKIALVGLSSPTTEERLELSIKAMRELGFEVVVGESCKAHYGYLSGSDDMRANDLNTMFSDKSISGIFAIRGGYGSTRILDKLDYNMIKKNAKVFSGYSDVTAIHNVINKRCNFITFHAPMPATEMYKGLDKYTEYYFKKSIFTLKPLGKLRNIESTEIKTLFEGEAEGRLVGGNLSVICSTLGTDYEIDTKGKILFLEEIDEYPYKIDRMIMQLKQCNKLKDASGIILGKWTDCLPPKGRESLSLMQIFEELIASEGKPALYDVYCGHCLPTLTLPLGAKIKINADNQEINILE